MYTNTENGTFQAEKVGKHCDVKRLTGQRGWSTEMEETFLVFADLFCRLDFTTTPP